MNACVLWRVEYIQEHPLFNEGKDKTPCGFELVTCGFELVTRELELVTCGLELVTRVLLFHFKTDIWLAVFDSVFYCFIKVF